MSSLPAPVMIGAADDSRGDELRTLVEEFNAETDPSARTLLIERIRELRAELSAAAIEP